ncbi:BDR-repeat family protein [Elysia marginata]|uniref:BDR-repeat family protein n=1 Tax=Elysia marginata TaxID=1093978 RepID=A0AAV4IVQ9_9GAST|nr:BDR-repeat family protein [Elysia marginata]
MKNQISSYNRFSHAPEVEIASVTQAQPRITRVSNGIKVEGFLNAEKASLTLEMVKSVDCMAEFTCRVRSVDTNGQESVTSTQVRQSNKQSPVYSPSLTPSVSLQILDLVYRLQSQLTVTQKLTENLDAKLDNLDQNVNTKLDLVDKTAGKIDNQLGILQNNLYSKVDQVIQTTNDLQTKMKSLDDNMSSEMRKISDDLETKVESLGHRLHDQLDSTERNLQTSLAGVQNRMEDKLHDDCEEKIDQVHMKITSLANKPHTYGKDDVTDSLNTSLTELGKIFRLEQKEVLAGVSPDMQNTLITGIVSSLQNWTRTQLHFQTDRLENLEQAVNSVLETNKNISKALSDDFAVWKRDYVNSFQEMTTNMYNNVSKILSTSEDLVTRSTVTFRLVTKPINTPSVYLSIAVRLEILWDTTTVIRSAQRTETMTIMLLSAPLDMMEAGGIIHVVGLTLTANGKLETGEDRCGINYQATYQCPTQR